MPRVTWEHRAPATRWLREAEGDWLREARPWTVFATPTFRYVDISRADAFNLLSDWLKTLARYHYKEHLHFAWAFGLKHRGVTHFHILLEAPSATDDDKLAARKMWRNASARTGMLDWQRYNPKKAAAHYMANHGGAAQDSDNMGMNVACPRTDRRCTRRFCAVARGPLRP